MQYETIQNPRHDLSGLSMSIAVEENIEDIKNYLNKIQMLPFGKLPKPFKYQKQRYTGF